MCSFCESKTQTVAFTKIAGQIHKHTHRSSHPETSGLLHVVVIDLSVTSLPPPGALDLTSTVDETSQTDRRCLWVLHGESCGRRTVEQTQTDLSQSISSISHLLLARLYFFSALLISCKKKDSSSLSYFLSSPVFGLH